MSNIPPLGRTRSLRQPGSSTTTPGSTSPSRLPMKPPPRPTGIATGSTAATTASSRALARATGATAASSNAGSSTRTRAPTVGTSSRHSSGSTYADRNVGTTTTVASSMGGVRGSRSNSRASPTATTGPAYPTRATRSTSNSRASPTGSVMSTSSTSTTATTTRPPPRSATTRYPPLSQSAIVSQAGVAGSSSGATGGRPKSSSGAPSTPGRTAGRPAGMGHVRAKSTVTTLTKETTLGRPGAAGTSGSSTTVAGNARTTRSQYGHGRTLSTDKASVSATATAGGAGVAARPAFNMNQQHYSPLKNHAPKPLTATFLAPPSPSKLPANVAISAETTRLQTELLQLSLLHRDVQVVKDEWSESAREKLGARFEEVASENRELMQLERRGAEGHNIAALIRWSENNSRIPLDDKIQTLDQVLAGVWALSASEQYNRVTREFEDWAERVADILAAQRKGSAEDLLDEDDEVCFVSELDSDGWKGDCAGMVRRLEGWQTALRSLGKVPPAISKEERRGEETGRSAKAQTKAKLRGLRQPPPPQHDDNSEAAQQPSSLEKILDHCENLVNDMLAELEVMGQIERDALQSENDWILRVNREFRGGKDPYNDEERPPPRDVIATPSTGGTVPLWKMVL